MILCLQCFLWNIWKQIITFDVFCISFQRSLHSRFSCSNGSLDSTGNRRFDAGNSVQTRQSCTSGLSRLCSENLRMGWPQADRAWPQMTAAHSASVRMTADDRVQMWYATCAWPRVTASRSVDMFSGRLLWPHDNGLAHRLLRYKSGMTKAWTWKHDFWKVLDCLLLVPVHTARLAHTAVFQRKLHKHDDLHVWSLIR